MGELECQEVTKAEMEWAARDCERLMEQETGIFVVYLLTWSITILLPSHRLYLPFPISPSSFIPPYFSFSPFVLFTASSSSLSSSNMFSVALSQMFQNTLCFNHMKLYISEAETQHMAVIIV